MATYKQYWAPNRPCVREWPRVTGVNHAWSYQQHFKLCTNPFGHRLRSFSVQMTLAFTKSQVQVGDRHRWWNYDHARWRQSLESRPLAMNNLCLPSA